MPTTYHHQPSWHLRQTRHTDCSHPCSAGPSSFGHWRHYIRRRRHHHYHLHYNWNDANRVDSGCMKNLEKRLSGDFRFAGVVARSRFLVVGIHWATPGSSLAVRAVAVAVAAKISVRKTPQALTRHAYLLVPLILSKLLRLRLLLLGHLLWLRSDLLL
jgi:hypothetical protein